MKDHPRQCISRKEQPLSQSSEEKEGCGLVSNDKREQELFQNSYCSELQYSTAHLEVLDWLGNYGITGKFTT